MSLPPWITALSATLLMQTVSSFMGQILPVVAPLMTQDLGLRPERVGNFASLNTLGSIIFLALGAPLMLRLGPVRLLQAGAALASVALLLATLGVLPLLLLGAVMLGLGYGPTGPAGSRILQATAPPRHRVLIFSVKQAGAPLGGALAGLIAAPVAAAYGWPSAFLLGIVLAGAAALAIQPMRARLDAEREPDRPWLGSPGAALKAPFAALGLHPELPRLTLLAFAFAVVQGSLFSFTVTWLVEAHGFALTVAGGAFAVMQGCGVGGRLLLGWLADRTGNATRNLSIQAVVAALLTAGFILFAPGQPFWALATLGGLTGIAAASWNGIFLAEVARLSPPDRLGEATAGATLFCFLGYLTAPSAFALAVTMTGSWTLPFLAAASVLAVIALWVGVSGQRGTGR
jgi:MFS family permease